MVPVSGDASLALSFDGAAAVASVTPSASVTTLTSPLSLETRFRVEGGAAGGVLLNKLGAFRLGWTDAGGLGLSLDAVIDGVRMPTVRAHTLRRYDDGEEPPPGPHWTPLDPTGPHWTPLDPTGTGISCGCEPAHPHPC